MPPSSKDSVPISKILKICAALEFLCCCVCLHQSWPIACTLVKRGEYSLSHDTQFSGMNLFITFAHDQSVVIDTSMTINYLFLFLSMSIRTL